MKCTNPEIAWHNRDPVLSVDIQSSQTNRNIYRLATGGTDTHVLIWQLIILENGGVSVEMLSDLTRHTRAVNVVRFSPNGQVLASGDDDAAIILWKKNEDLNDGNDLFIDENEKENKEHWTILKMLRNHIEDVYDLCWSSCSQFLVSGSVDNSAILWDVHKGKSKSILKDHKGFVQGVAWDPKGQLVATLSSDRFLRVFNISSDKVKLVNRVHKSVLSDGSSEEVQKTTRLFYDDTLKSFCRRLAFSPDGEFLVTPSGILEESDGTYTNASHLFIRSCLNRPVMCFPTQDKYTIAVRFCPLLFELRKLKISEDAENPPYAQLFNLPYRMVFAVATQNALLIYDTQQPIPFAKVSNIHYTRLSDLSWSSDGRILVVSSTDGYCSLVSFAEGELGVIYHPVKEEQSPKLNTHPVKEEQSPKLNTNDLCKSSPGGEEKMEVDDESQKENDENAPNRIKEDDEKDKSRLERKPKPQSHKVATPITVKRKSGKRVELITLTKSTLEKKNDSVSSGTEKKDIAKEEDSELTLNKTSIENDTKVPEENETPKVSLTESDQAPSIPLPKTPRRVSLITLSSPKNKNFES